MTHGTRALYRSALPALLLGGAVWLTGCGSGSGGSALSGSTGTRVTGIVEAPATQVAAAPVSGLAKIARAFALGSPAEAMGAVNRRRVRGATVTVIRVTDAAQVGQTVTDSSGQFSVDLTGVQVGDIVIFVVKADGAGGKLLLRRIVSVGGGQQTTTVNEATTVGAAAADEGLADGATPQDAVVAAEQTTTAQEAAEEQDPSNVPDVHEGAQAHIREHAQGHLQANMDSKLTLALTGTPSAQQVAQAIMATQAYARVNFRLSPEIHLSQAQVLALANLVIAKTTFTKEHIAEALGLTSLTAADDLDAALAALQAKPHLSGILSSLEADKVPAVVVLLLAEESNTGFQIKTQDQLNALINALAPAPVPGPTPLPDLGGDTTTTTPADTTTTPADTTTGATA